MINFTNYPSMTEVIIPDSVKLPNTLTTAFSNMQNLTSVNMTIPNNVTNMTNMFYNCRNLSRKYDICY